MVHKRKPQKHRERYVSYLVNREIKNVVLDYAIYDRVRGEVINRLDSKQVFEKLLERLRMKNQRTEA